MIALIKRLSGGDDLSGRSKRATIWTVLDFGGVNALRLVSNLALTRLLTPEIFGLMALAQVFLTGVRTLSEVGSGLSVVRSLRGDEDAFLGTAWSVQVLRGITIFGISCLIAWPLSLLYGQPILFPLLCVLSITSLIDGVRSISAAKASRNLRLKTLTVISLVSKGVTLCVTVGLAFVFPSVWVLAVGAIFGTTLRVVLGHLLLPRFKHRFGFEPEALREIFVFGRWILLGTFLTFFGLKGQQAIHGLLVPVELVGLIAIAGLIASLPYQLVNKLLTQIAFPSFSEVLRERPAATRRLLRKVRLLILLGVFPVFFFFSYFAGPIIDLLYDPRYALASVFLTLMALNNAILIMSGSYQNLLLAEGRSDLHALLASISAFGMIVGIFAGFQVYGVIGSFVGIGLAALVLFVVNFAIALRRGYATGALDIFALIVALGFYAFTLQGLDVPASFTSPELLQNVVP